MATFDLVLPFLTDDRNFALGVEIGMLFQQMKIEEEIRDYFLLDNQEQITLMANRLGWKIETMQPWGNWVLIHMVKTGAN